MNPGALGREYQDGETIIRQGEVADCMFVIQDGHAEVLVSSNGKDVRLSLLRKGDLFGEAEIFEDVPRSVTVRALGRARVLSVDKRSFLRRMHEDPSVAYRVVQTMSRRVRHLSERLAMQETWTATGTA